MQRSVLYDRTLELVRERKKTETYKSIGEATGLNPRWVEAFAQGRFDAPSVCNVEALYTYLNGAPLVLGGDA